VTLLHAVHGWSAIIVLCSLLFVEEAGLPVPMAPGDVLLVGAGVLISTGALDPWLFIPLACLASLGGAMVAYTWARALGSRGLQSLAGRLGARSHLERATERLRSAGPLTIGGCRMVPGLRINTTLVCGALQVERRTFLLGVVPPIAVWVLGFTALGAAVGIPLVHSLGRFEHLALQGAVLMAIGLAGYLAVRHLPGAPGDETPPVTRLHAVRLGLAVVVDLAALALIVSGLDMIVDASLRLRDVNAGALVSLQLAAAVAAYLVLSRVVSRTTLGEALFRVTYRARRRKGRAVPSA
jgi:membrane protein DedA with SNARE-associated domain